MFFEDQFLIKIIVIIDNINPIIVKVFGDILLFANKGINEAYNNLLQYNFNLFLCILV